MEKIVILGVLFLLTIFIVLYIADFEESKNHIKIREQQELELKCKFSNQKK